MFLLRCLFWLGLVFSQIAQKEGADLSAAFGPRAPAAARQSASLPRLAANAAEDHCRANPTQCLALAATVAGMNPRAESRDTLTATDRAPAWKTR